MSLSPGDRVGPYEVVGAIGAGGMGEVYRAHDAKLNRDVAIKILPDLFAADPDRRARFDREAQTLAALNHPNIAHIHGVEGTALVMEFVDGEDLAQRISRGAVPIDEALAIARQIADALQAAHDRGIVHRDLKPANVKVRPDGTVKVLDFGLAKLGAQEPSAAVSTSPTFTSPAMMTHAGVIIGTAAYMAPEQAKGKPVDRRADLWALGVVLFEMLAGRSAFEGETITDVLAAVVTRDPDWSALPAQTPHGVRRLLARCLQRDPRRRLADAGEAAYQIEEATTAAAETAPPAIQSATGPSLARRPAYRGIAIALPWLILGITLAAGLPLWREWRTAQPASPLRYSVERPPKTTFNTVSRPAMAISPDGKTVAFIGTAAGQTQIYIRRQSEFESRVIPGTDGASEPVFSPDGRWVAFFASNKLNRVSVDGGPVDPLADVNDPRGLAWDTDDVITFTPQVTGGVFALSLSHPGAPRQLTTPKDKLERTHRWAQMLPNGAVIFTVGSLSSPDNYDGATIEGVLKTGERREILKGAAMARYVAPDALLFSRGGSLFATPFDPDTLQVRGTPVVVAQAVAVDGTTGATNFAYSAAGTLAYIGGSADSLHRLVWADRTGKTQPLDLPPAMYLDVKLAPDGRRLAVLVVAGGGADIWVYDLARKTFTRLTFGGSHRTPVWSADGSTLYYIALAPDGSSNQVMKRPADGSREEEVVVALKSNMFLRDVPPDGAGSALMDYSTAAQKEDIATLALEKGAQLVPLIATRFDEYCPARSPDGKWLAYQSDETSRHEIYVREATGKGGRWPISTAGGEEPRWSADGRELFYRADTQMMAVRIEPGAAFQSSAPRVLFDGLYNLRSESGVSFDVDSKNDRFLMVRLADDSAPAGGLRIIVNWTTELKQLMAGAR